MKKLYLLCLTGFLFVASNKIQAQNDLALAAPNGAILAPVSGCNLTNSESVTVRIFNFGPGTVTVPFQISYNITGPVSSSATETVNSPNIPPNTSFIYTFTAPADLSVPGTYSLTATATLAGDPNSSNDTYSSYTIDHYPPSVGGTVNSSMNVCYGSNSGNLTLTGHTGNVLNWEYSTDGGVTWFNIGNPTTVQPYNNLTVTTQYRALVQNASCPPVYSSIATLTVDPQSVGGSISGPNSTCQGYNVNLTLNGYTGSIVRWEYSIDGGATWNIISNTSPTYSTTLTQTTRFRVLVQSGVCPAVYSAVKNITVSPSTVPGTINPSTQTVCSGNNSGTLTLTGYTGSIIRWQYSINGGATWINISNTTNTQSFSNLTQTTWYRAQVKSGVCPLVSSSPAIVNVVPNSDGGNVSPLTINVCSGTNQDTLFLSGFSGSILDWEFSTDGGVTWNSTGLNDDTLIFSNLTSSTLYRAVVQAGSCPVDYSDTASVLVDSPTVGGVLSDNDTVCILSNSGTLNLTGQTGNVVQWEMSTDFGTTWQIINNTNTTYSFNNLTDTTLFRVLVQNGVCPSAYSNNVEIVVDTLTVPGNVTGGTTVCELANSGTMMLNGNNGMVMNWQLSTDGGLSWVNINNQTTALNYNNLNTTTLFRANVKNGVCPAEFSTYDIVYVDKASQGGNIIGGNTVCEGNNSGTLSLVGHYGSIVTWEYSTDNGATWTSNGNTNIQQAYSNLTQTTQYRVLVQSGVCPQDTSLVGAVNVLPKPVISFNTDTVCFGQPMQFVNNTTIPPGYIVLHNWDFGDGTSATIPSPVHTYNDTGNFNVKLIAMSNFGCLDSLTLNARVEPLPNVDITVTGQTEFCSGDSAVLSVVNPSSNAVYQWNDGDNALTKIIYTSGNYQIIAQDTLTGCKDSSSKTINVFPLPVIYVMNDTTIKMGQSVQLMASGGVAYEWSPADDLDNPYSSTPVASPVVTTTYYVTVYNALGCKVMDSVLVNLSDEIEFTVYDIITPNGDGHNDRWEIKNIHLYPDNEVTIFNRQGNIVYQKESYDNSWDGTYNGKPLPQGTYYYILKIKSNNQTQNGAINIISNNLN